MSKVKLPTGTFKAACLIENRKPLEILDISFPIGLSSKQVLVRNLLTSICGSQIGEIDGKKGKDPYLPHLLGHEAISEVIAVATDVENVEVGQKVVLHWMKGKGGEAQSHSQISNGNKINAGPITTFSEYSVVSENRCTSINTSLDLAELPQFGCSWTTAYGSLKNDAQISNEDFLLVLGLGAIGVSTLEVSKLFDVKFSLGIDYVAEKVKYVQGIGFNAISWDFSGQIPQQIENILGNYKARRFVIIETTGNVEVINRAYSMLGKLGVLVLVGVTAFGKKIEIDPMPLHFGAEIKGSFGGSCNPTADIPYLIELAETKRFNVKALKIRTFDLSQINQAIDLIRAGSIEKMTIDLR